MLEVPVTSISHIKWEEALDVANKFNRFGAAVLVPQAMESSCQQSTMYQSLDALFGQRIHHEKANEHGILVVNPQKPSSANVLNRHATHQPHTDDCHFNHPTLQCRKACQSGGGASILVSGHNLLQSIAGQSGWEESGLKEMMTPGNVEVGRQLPGSTQYVSSFHPLFSVDSKTRRLLLRWRSHDAYVKMVRPEALEAYTKMNFAVQSSYMLVRLEPGMILVVDNRAVAHGRTPFAATDERCVWRVNYAGDPSGHLTSILEYGCASVDF